MHAHYETFQRSWAEYYAAVYQVPVELVAAIIDEESGWNPYAVSNKGAAGIMQLMPATAVRFGVRNRFLVQENIRGGVAYLAWLKQKFNGDLRLITAAYYVGEYRNLFAGTGVFLARCSGLCETGRATVSRETSVQGTERVGAAEAKVEVTDEKRSSFRLAVAVGTDRDGRRHNKQPSIRRFAPSPRRTTRSPRSNLRHIL